MADQLALLRVLQSEKATYLTTRNAAADYMKDHPDDFIPFLPSETGEDGRGPNESGLMGPREFSNYCSTIRETGTWGGEPEILALARSYNVPIHVVQAGNPSVVIHDPTEQHLEDLSDPRAVRISYHRRMYGLGEVCVLSHHSCSLLTVCVQHYNSLRPKGRLAKVTHTLKSFAVSFNIKQVLSISAHLTVALAFTNDTIV